MKDASIIRTGSGTPHDRGGGVRTRYLVTRELGAGAFLSGITEFEPGASLALHSHNCEESVVILEGEATFETASGTTALSVGDATFVPAGVVHRFANDGAAPLRILWTYGSVGATRTLAATGETLPIETAPDASR